MALSESVVRSLGFENMTAATAVPMSARFWAARSLLSLAIGLRSVMHTSQHLSDQIDALLPELRLFYSRMDALEHPAPPPRKLMRTIVEQLVRNLFQTAVSSPTLSSTL